mgnify:CR=1 FL=1
MKCYAMSCKNNWGEHSNYCSVLNDLRKANCSLDKQGKCIHYSMLRGSLYNRDYSQTYCSAVDCINHCGVSCQHFGFWNLGASPELGVDGVCIHYLSDAIDAPNEVFTPVCELAGAVFSRESALC